MQGFLTEQLSNLGLLRPSGLSQIVNFQSAIPPELSRGIGQWEGFGPFGDLEGFNPNRDQPAIGTMPRPSPSRVDCGKLPRMGRFRLGNLIEIQDGVPLYCNEQAEASTLSDRVIWIYPKGNF
ncbi:hypothetical protein [Oscillatoria acuminata]|uniref:Uncharacterized protein n=1 Tax=Oscillatoria acuminata PCC 6304 TaxID=56110 RepID=K9TN50_9CYAN|nr:hypothetical protein [Oscillatoria acuminata]AFY83449.1 hypothetical protein Oscil6304_3900 [Oscillatoria acuminata PCC 6304]